MNHVVHGIRPRANAKDHSDETTQQKKHRIATIHIQVPKPEVNEILKLLARENCPWPIKITYAERFD
jgi:hypothetical protein